MEEIKINSEEHRKDVVKITVNGKERDIHRGSRTVSEIKTVGEVPLNYMLEQFVDGKLVPLADDDRVLIKGGEVFIGHIKDGSSS